ncbi:MAG: DUF6291 domain-containing protein [Pseudomonadales bacterium]|jgi:hypothetical protein|nr:DUF6291 domain-containing protein [Pseudomonadales bacterium]
MKKEKKSFVLYTDLIKRTARLTTEQKGKLFEAILQYENGQEPHFDDPKVEGMFYSVQIDLDDNAEKYKEKCKKNADAAKARWERERVQAQQSESMRTYASASAPMHDHAKRADSEIDSESGCDNNFNLLGSPPNNSKSSPMAIANLLDGRLKSLLSRIVDSDEQYYYPWQEKAARYALKIGLNLDGMSKGSPIKPQWCQLFKNSDENANGKLANLEAAFQHFVDNDKNKSFGDEVKFLIFCKIYHNGRDAVLNKNKKKGQNA